MSRRPAFALPAPPVRAAPTAIASYPARRPRPSLCSTVASLYSPPPRFCSTVASLYSPPAPRLSSSGRPPRPPAPRARRGDGGGGDGGGDAWHAHILLSPAAHLVARLSRALRAYNRALLAAPLLTKALSSAVLVLLSDAVAQALSKPQPTDVPRLIRHMVYGLLIAGPQGHYWFSFLDAFVKVPGPAGIAAKLALDQLAFAPLSTAAFFGLMKTFEGAGLAKAVDFVKENFAATMINGWKVWPLVNLVNFSLVAPQHRVVFTSVVSVFWIAFLSLVANEQQGEQTAPAAL